MSEISGGGTSPDELAAAVGQWFRDTTGEAGAGTVVAVSGGLDSMVLLDLLARDRQLCPRLHVAHFDHQLRPESGADAVFVAQEGARRRLPVTTAAGDVRRLAAGARISLEMAARELRFEFLHRVMTEAGCEFIALGHHADDQAETVIMRLLRGSASGLGGMAPVRGKRYLRPLLAYTRDTLAEYAASRDVAYRDDASNRDPKFLRNRVRRELLPRLRSFNPQIVRTLTRSAELLRDEDDWLSQEASAAAAAAVTRADSTRIVLAAPTLANYHIAIQRRVLRHSLRAITPPRAEAGRAAIDALVDLAHGPVAGIVDLGSGMRAQRRGDSLVLSAGAAVPVDRSFEVPAVVFLPERSLEFHSRFLPGRSFAELAPRLGSWEAVFDADSLGPEPLRLRGMEEGDRMHPFGLEGRHKKVRDLLAEAGYPRLLRDESLLLTHGREILWVAGLRTGHGHRVTSATRHILHCEFKPSDTASQRSE